jgi:hypothetical protein
MVDGGVTSNDASVWKTINDKLLTAEAPIDHKNICDLRGKNNLL